ncbi:MAG TPA: asparagine synthase (glutamine-hydrolyzing) [Blastocatellia bacterium]|nr:asparagine synthase (glutamine-hydrolyzing) [Blastocatellia bacterium]
MCGIAGIISNNLPDIARRIERMSESVAHRGPDAAGLEVWTDGARRAAFAHRRLAIIDLSESGRQPMQTDDGRYSVIFNGEIYNYLSLRESLASDGVEFGSNTDTEVFLHLYKKYGRDCLRFLRGMFAFALRDRETGEVFAARDRLGIKPFYYYCDGSLFVFASEIRALLSSGLVPREIDATSLSSYLSFGAVQEPRTIIKNVRSLPPAHYVTIESSGAVKEIAPYWQLPEPSACRDRKQAVEETRARLEESVRLHLVSDVPLGAFLSGGIDSSSIVAFMSKQAAGRVNTFSVCFREQEFSESALARVVAEKWGTSHTEIALSEEEMLAALPDAISSIDQPTIDGINTWVISRATRRAGITVALSGLGGDELFGGYPSFKRARAIDRYLSPMARLNPSRRRQVAAVAARVMGDTLRSQKVASAITEGGDLLASYLSMRGLFSKAARRDLMRESAREAIDADHEYDMPAEALALIEGGDESDVFNRISRYEMSFYMANMLLRDTDAMSMASALEVRVPMLDHELVEWVYALPGEMKKGRAPKQLLIEALGADLPAEIVEHKKMGFALPFERWLHTSLRPFVSDVLSDSQSIARSGLDAAAVGDVASSFDAGARSTSWTRVWALTVLVDWCRRHDVSMPEF